MTLPAGSLLLHADDFGFSAAVTRGIVRGFHLGLLTSTSLLTNAPAAEMAVDEWRRLESLRQTGKFPSAAARRRVGDPDLPFDLGVHLNLTQGRPLTAERFPAALLDARRRFLSPARLFFRLITVGHRWQAAIAAELSAQVEWLIGRGLQPTHLNGHQYVEMMPVVSRLVPQLAVRYQVPYVRAACEPRHARSSLAPGLRVLNAFVSLVKHHYADSLRRSLVAANLAHAEAFFGASHAGRIDLPIARRFLNLATGFNTSEIALHPGDSPADNHGATLADGWIDPLADARPAELALLYAASFADALGETRLTLGRIRLAQRHRAVAA